MTIGYNEHDHKFYKVKFIYKSMYPKYKELAMNLLGSICIVFGMIRLIKGVAEIVTLDIINSQIRLATQAGTFTAYSTLGGHSFLFVAIVMILGLMLVKVAHR